MRIRPQPRNLEAAEAIGRKDFRTAIALLEGELSRSGEDREALTMLAQCHEWLGEYENAVRYAERLLDGDPRDLRALKLAARCFGELGDLDYVYNHVCRALEAPCPAPGPRGRLARVLARVPLVRRWLGRRHVRRHAREAEWRAWALRWKRWYESVWTAPERRVLH